MKRLLFVIGLLPAILFSQEANTPASFTFGCSDERTDFYEHPVTKFVPVPAPIGHERWMHRAFEGFDRASYGFSSVEFFLNPVTTAGYNGDWGQNESQITAAQLYVVVHGTTDSWFLLQAPPMLDNPQEPSLLYVQPQKKDEQDQASEAEESNAPHNPFDDWISGDPATPDPKLPLFTLLDSYADHGANAGGTIQNNFLVDLRSGKPELRAAAQCIDWEGGGACTAPDTGEESIDYTACQWKTANSDFLCTTRGPFGGDYNPVYSRHEFYLLSGKEPARLSFAPDALNSLADFTLSFRNAKPGDRALVRNIGYVDLLWKSADLVPGSLTMLLASPGAGDQDNARFYLATLNPGAQPTISEIPKWSIGGEDSDDDKAPAGFTPDDNTVSTTANEFAISNGAHLFKAIHSRPLEPGRFVRVVYLLGVQLKVGTLVANAVRVASSGSKYAGCGQEAADSTATNFNWNPAEQSALVTIEPVEQTIMANGEDSPQQCTWEGRLRWVDGLGFRVRKLHDLCKAVAQDVSIDQQGNISTKPRQRDQQ